MGSATKGWLMKNSNCSPTRPYCFTQRFWQSACPLGLTISLGGWIRILICRIPIWPFCRGSSSFQPAQSMNVGSPQMFSSPQKRKCLEGQRGTLNIVCQGITKCHRHSKHKWAVWTATAGKAPAKDMLCGCGASLILLKPLCLSWASEGGRGASRC